MMNLHAQSWRGVLYAFVDGDAELASCKRLFEKTIDTAAHKRLSKILVDGRLLSGVLPTSELLELTERVTDHVRQLGKNMDIAFVGRLPTFSGIGVRIAQEHGLVVQLFRDISKAIEWLGGVKTLHQDPASLSVKHAHGHSARP